MVSCSELAMSDTEEEGEARCKGMLNKLIVEVKRQTKEMEDLAVRMNELAVGLKAVVQPRGVPEHALPPSVTTPVSDAALAPESPTRCTTSGTDSNAGCAKVTVVSLLSRGVTNAIRAQAEKSFAVGELDNLMPARCSMVGSGDDTASQTSTFMSDTAPGSPSTADLLNVAITSPKPTVATIRVRDDTSDLAAHQLLIEVPPWPPPQGPGTVLELFHKQTGVQSWVTKFTNAAMDMLNSLAHGVLLEALGPARKMDCCRAWFVQGRKWTPGVRLLAVKKIDKTVGKVHGGASTTEQLTINTSLISLRTFVGGVDETRGIFAFLDGGAVISLSMFYLQGVVVFPEAALPLRVIQPRSLAVVGKAINHVDAPCMIGVVHVYQHINDGHHAIALVGTTAEIQQIKQLDVGAQEMVDVLKMLRLFPGFGKWVCNNPRDRVGAVLTDGETVLKEVELEDPLENLGVKLVRQAGARTNDIAGDDCTTSIILAQGLIAEGMKVLAAGINPVQIARGIEKTAAALVSELILMSREIKDREIAHVAAVSAGNDYSVGDMISDAFKRVGRKGTVRIENGRGTETGLEIVEGMQFERGYLSPYFVTDRANMSVGFIDCKILLVDKKITDASEIIKILDSAVKENYPLLIIAEDVEEEARAPLIRNKLSGTIKVAAIKAPSFGEQKTQCLDDIAIMTGGTVVRDDMGYTLEKAGKEVYSHFMEDKNVTLFFNCVYPPVGATLDDHYTAFGDLDKSTQALVEQWSKVAYEHMKFDLLDYEMDNGQARLTDSGTFQGSTFRSNFTGLLQRHTGQEIFAESKFQADQQGASVSNGVSVGSEFSGSNSQHCTLKRVGSVQVRQFTSGHENNADASLDISVHLESGSGSQYPTIANDITDLLTLHCPSTTSNEITGSVTVDQAALAMGHGAYEMPFANSDTLLRAPGVHRGGWIAQAWMNKMEAQHNHCFQTMLFVEAIGIDSNAFKMQLLHLRILMQQKHNGDCVQVRLGMDVLLVPWDPGGNGDDSFISAWGQAEIQGERNVMVSLRGPWAKEVRESIFGHRVQRGNRRATPSIEEITDRRLLPPLLLPSAASQSPIFPIPNLLAPSQIPTLSFSN